MTLLRGVTQMAVQRSRMAFARHSALGSMTHALKTIRPPSVPSPTRKKIKFPAHTDAAICLIVASP